MKKAILISAIASNEGKTILTMALLNHYKNIVRPYKCGPDFIDPQFHKHISKIDSINLDRYMMNDEQLKWIFHNYFDKDIAIVEGVMGYYDGMDKNASAYDVSKSLDIPSLIILDGSGSYITLSAVLKGLCSFRDDNNIKAVVINKVSSKMHYELIKKHINHEMPHIVVCGYIEKNLQTLSQTYLGLDLQDLQDKDISKISKNVLENIDINLLESIMNFKKQDIKKYPFKKVQKSDKSCALVHDKNFSFLYHDNLVYLKEIYKKVVVIDSTKDEMIGDDIDVVILIGGYVETDETYNRIKNSINFKNSLIKHHKNNKYIYAECAGMIYLSKNCDDKEMSNILPISFELTDKRQRLGYYKCDIDNEIIKGHAFHYTQLKNYPKTDIKLYKISKKTAKDGGFVFDNIYATYLHTMWRVNYKCYK